MHQSLRFAILSLALLTLLACGGDGDGGNSQGQEPANIRGTWSGTVQSTRGGASSPIAVTIAQSGRQITGRATASRSPCFSRATLIGSVDGHTFEARLRTEGDGRVELAGDIGPDVHFIDGTYHVTQGRCVGDTGHFALEHQ